jgi:hypothetical protein
MKNEEMSKDTKKGIKRDIEIRDVFLKFKYNAECLGLSANNTDKRLNNVFYRDTLNCNLPSRSTKIPKAMWDTIQEKKRLLKLKENKFILSDMIKSLQDVSDLPNDITIEVPFKGIDVFASNEDSLVVIESKTEKPNSGTLDELWEQMLTYISLLILKNKRDKTNKNIRIYIASEKTEKFKGHFQPEQLITYEKLFSCNSL